jgi:tryptophan 2,3-dioxygenase
VTADQAPPPLTYAGYLGLDQVLTAGNPVSDQLAEAHFIAAHQCIELRFRVVTAAIREAVRTAGDGRFDHTIRPLQRAAALLHSVLLEMSALDQALTPGEFATLRDALGTASGFQSIQWRELELLAGLSADPKYMQRLHAMHAGQLPPPLAQAAAEPTLRDAHRQAHTASPTSAARQVADLIGHLDELLMRWRVNHLVMVRHKLGDATAGTAGRTTHYLAATLTPAVPAAWGPEPITATTPRTDQPPHDRPGAAPCT